MRLAAPIQLQPTKEQIDLLFQTIYTANNACNWLSMLAWKEKVFKKFELHKLGYYECRKQFPSLSAQVIIRCIAKVADIYKSNQKKQGKFKPLGSINYDCRIISYPIESTISIWCIGGRQIIPYVSGEYQRKLLQNKRGEAQLIYRDNKFYLHISITIPDTEVKNTKDWLGIDMGITNIATTSDGLNFSGTHLNKIRGRNYRLRKRLQAKGTRSAKRLLRKRRRRERNFTNDVNHIISKRIVQIAKRTGRGIAREDLTGIRNRVRATRDQRRSLHSWAFADLAFKIDYKARLNCVPVMVNDPRYTSQRCPRCRLIDKRNRRTRDQFKCIGCGYGAPADKIGAINNCLIAVEGGAAIINSPYAPGVEVITIGSPDWVLMESEVQVAG